MANLEEKVSAMKPDALEKFREEMAEAQESMEDELDSTMNNIKSLISNSILNSSSLLSNNSSHVDASKFEESKLTDKPDEDGTEEDDT